MFILVFRGPLRQRKGHYSNGNKFFKELGLIKAIFKFIYVRDSLDIAVIKWTAVYMHDFAARQNLHRDVATKIACVNVP